MESIRKEIIKTCATLYRQGLACSTGGNVSARTGNTIYITKTDTALGRLEPQDIIACGMDGQPMEPGKPSKEISFHAAIYAARPEVGAVVHLHSPFGLMLGMFEELDQDDFLPPCTPYAVSRVGRVPVVEYYTPGSQILAQRVRERTGQAGNAIYLAKHGVITFASNLGRAADIAEEFELTARLYVLTGGRIPLLSTAEVKELRGKDEKKA